jgi:glycine/D-amino acid oxidase-like deaminating enzyme
MTDCLIVGRGLAATAAMHALHQRGMSFVAIGDPALSACSLVAAGVWHPVVFKRLTRSWRAETFIPFAVRFYRECEGTLGKKLLTERKLIRPFGEDQEKALWRKKAAAELQGFIDPDIHERNDFPGCRIPYGYGVVRAAGNLDVKLFVTASASYFGDRVLTARFVHGELTFDDDGFSYKGIRARHILFCEGPAVEANPFFNWVQMRPSKGEILTVEFERPLFKDAVINKGGFLLDVSERIYRAGATYAWDDLTDEPTAPGRDTLEGVIRSITDVPYRVVSHEAGVRPSSFDRRPIVGEHPAHRGMYILNGLGTRGVTLAPWFAAKFVIFCRKEDSLEPESDVTRFRSLYEAARKA